jgi:hypothetical protein
MPGKTSNGAGCLVVPNPVIETIKKYIRVHVDAEGVPVDVGGDSGFRLVRISFNPSEMRNADEPWETTFYCKDHLEDELESSEDIIEHVIKKHGDELGISIDEAKKCISSKFEVEL